jgi:hypothetical protein
MDLMFVTDQNSYVEITTPRLMTFGVIVLHFSSISTAVTKHTD